MNGSGAKWTTVFLGTSCVAAAVACSDGARAPEPTPPPAVSATVQAAEQPREISPRMLRRFKALEPVIADGAGAPSASQIALGRRLFSEPRLSADGTVACSSCHDLSHYGADGAPTSTGIRGARGSRNAPTVFNAAGHFAEFWDGRAKSIEEQAKGPMLNPIEMGMPSGEAVVAVLKKSPDYVAAFRSAFPGDPEPLTFDNVGRAIGAFERQLTTPGRWDLYLAGDRDALSAQEKGGLRTFLNVGCMVCHTGAYVGGASFERVGAVEPWPNQADPGRWAVTHQEQDRMMFKVPSLRNVEKTAPYFHDASAETLEDAVRKMGTHQLGIELSPAEVTSIAAWLRALTGEARGVTP